MLSGRKYSIQIPEPCHESWDKMHQVDSGKFCDSCSKVVTDFTHMSEKEIAAFFANRPQGICGRFKQEQLLTKYTKPVTLNLPFHQRLIRYVVSLFLMGTAAKQARSQSQDTVVVQQDSLKKNDTAAVVSEPLLTDSIVSGPDSTEIAQQDSTETEPPEPKTVTITISSGYITGAVSTPYIYVMPQITERFVYGYTTTNPTNPFCQAPKRTFGDTISYIVSKWNRRNTKSGEPNHLDEQEPSAPKPPPNPARDRKIEGVLPAFFSWRGKKSSANGKQS